MNLLDLEDEKFKTVTVKGQTFKIRAMFPKDKLLIMQRRMKFQDGNPVEAMQVSDFLFIENIAIVDICTEQMPKDFKTNESCINWQDEELIHLVANEIKNHTAYIEGELKKNRPFEGSE